MSDETLGKGVRIVCMLLWRYVVIAFMMAVSMAALSPKNPTNDDLLWPLVITLALAAVVIAIYAVHFKLTHPDQP